ncbi:MAG: mechanosensitive ion channel [Bacteroidetes bacterium]|nr:mechanosensitive ion channel [Bacteroidota bacterium]
MELKKELFFQMSLYDFLVIGITLILCYVLVRSLRHFLSRYYRRISLRDEERITSLKFIGNITAFVIYSIGIMIVVYNIPPLRKVGLSLFASAGILAAIVGFASQAAISNIIGGVFIVIFKPFRVGDFVRIADTYVGIVEDVTIRHTVIRSFENRRIIIPNSIVNTETIINSSIIDDKVCNFIEFGIAYDADIDKAREIIKREAIAHPNCYDNRTDEEIQNNQPVVKVRVISLADFSVNLRAFVWTENYDKGYDLKLDLLESVKKAFDKEGIEIPFPYRTIVYKSDLQKQQISQNHNVGYNQEDKG